ncbi:SUMF1/EgtB/PvdO family nonheme iron enzyme [Pelomonas sp. P7]|uniref:SUMF1/EgtB/PvdO family nonheme iron enzyme n=1 Tax=Pelomonas caseinilytica TaxID=2906763 RepID=A0ABS8XIJ2_9BURK|nr:selenoneine synthase SenA [Pelomonas sp. P7]MCE4539377.1 SUMF1/EgtB/PvdO family nonheme iron enzyme [Pelomonas sp. P7]
MHPASVAAEATGARQGGPSALAAALAASRADTLATFAACERALPGLAVPLLAELNPPLWELGHIGWFQEFWIARNPERALGDRASADAPRTAPLRPGADALYDSSRVPHDSRWQLPLPDAGATRGDLDRQLALTLQLLASAGDGDDALYAFRLALLHEDMHHEAALYMARGLGVPIADPRWQPRRLPEPPGCLEIDVGTWRLGSPAGAGFAFDNELPAHEVALRPFGIDAQALRWAEYLPFVEAGGYGQPQWWTAEGWRWRRARAECGPRHLRRDGKVWLAWRHGLWQPLELAEAAVNLSRHEAEAWCAWAGRRLPTEAEWEAAACSRPEAFRWADVWEWTASPFSPFDGFRPHPYRDYSAPWFDGRPVLRGASHCTQPRMRHPRYRNFFPAGRNDVPAGLRSCSAG